MIGEGYLVGSLSQSVTSYIDSDLTSRSCLKIPAGGFQTFFAAVILRVTSLAYSLGAQGKSKTGHVMLDGSQDWSLAHTEPHIYSPNSKLLHTMDDAENDAVNCAS